MDPKNPIPAVFLAAAVSFVVVGPAHGQCPNETAKLLASDGMANEQFSRSIAVDGDRAIVGAPGDDDNGPGSGSAYVYRRDGPMWIEEAKLLPEDGMANDFFGVSVSISGDVTVVGARNDVDNGSGSGSAYVYRYSAETSTWILETKLFASDGVVGDHFGFSVSISGDVAVVGAMRDDDACPQDPNCDSGSAYVYRYSSETSTWTEEAKLLASDGAADDRFGVSVSVSGGVAVVGARRDDDNGNDSGSAYIYRHTPATFGWREEAKLLASDGAVDDQFGYSVAVSGDVAVIGAYGDDDNGPSSGSAYIYRSDGPSWMQEAKLLASDGAAGDSFGASASISEDMAVVGAWGDDNNGVQSGSAYVYRYDGTMWLQRVRLRASDTTWGDQLGSNVAVSGDVAVVGARRDDDNGVDSGSAYVFDLAPPCAETICPDDPNDFFRQFGGPVTGFAHDLCASDDLRMDVLQSVPLSPLLPFIRLEFWAHSTLARNAVTSVDYTIEGHVSALVASGQNPDTLRTSIMNYSTGLFEIIDQRGTAANADETINYVQSLNAPDYVNAGDGEVRARQDVFDPGNVVTPNWFLKVDLYEVTVSE